MSKRKKLIVSANFIDVINAIVKVDKKHVDLKDKKKNKK